MNKLKNILSALGSLPMTLFCLGLMMLLTLFGTLAQVKMGTFAAQREYFNSVWVYGMVFGLKIPFFPGGLTVGFLWMVNLLAAFFTRFKVNAKNTGILVSHFGLILLLFGQFLTQTLAQESQMAIEEGQSRNYSESSLKTELAIMRTSPSNYDEAISIPASLLSRRSVIKTPALPFTLIIKRFYPNADLQMGKEGASLATQGLGTRIGVEGRPVQKGDNAVNNVTALIELRSGNKSLGTWLVSTALGGPQTLSVEGQSYTLVMRPKRIYYPFTMTLKDFRHDVYPGTDIPKNFSSAVHVLNSQTGESRDALIYMNHPLRYQGSTFYQSSFGKNDTLSIFQVVQNPAWITPYVSCALVLLGLAIQFVWHLLTFLKERRVETA